MEEKNFLMKALTIFHKILSSFLHNLSHTSLPNTFIFLIILFHLQVFINKQTFNFSAQQKKIIHFTSPTVTSNILVGKISTTKPYIYHICLKKICCIRWVVDGYPSL